MEHWKNLNLEDIVYTNKKGIVCKEEWADIESFDGYYQISNLGRVKFTGKEYIDSIGRKIKKRPRIRVCTFNLQGYLCTIIRKNNTNINIRPHRVVAETFIKNIDNKCCVNHINSNKLDNSVENLEWCTVRENNSHKIEQSSKIKSEKSGIRYFEEYNYWKVYICINNKLVFLGVFEDKTEAEKTYNKTLSDWEINKKEPEHNNRSRFTSKYKGISYSIKESKWLAQFSKNKETYTIGYFLTERQAKEALENVKDEYDKTGVFPKKKYASIYKGISRKDNLNKWQATVSAKGNKKYLGLFNTEEEAAEKIREYLGLESIEELLR